jgi:hypothetical protein
MPDAAPGPAPMESPESSAATDRLRSSPSGIAVLCAGLVVLAFGLLATLFSLGAETDEDVLERLATDPAGQADVAPPPSTALTPASDLPDEDGND